MEVIPKHNRGSYKNKLPKVTASESCNAPLQTSTSMITAEAASQSTANRQENLKRVFNKVKVAKAVDSVVVAKIATRVVTQTTTSLVTTLMMTMTMITTTTTIVSEDDPGHSLPLLVLVITNQNKT